MQAAAARGFSKEEFCSTVALTASQGALAGSSSDLGCFQSSSSSGEGGLEEEEGEHLERQVCVGKVRNAGAGAAGLRGPRGARWTDPPFL